MPDEAVSHADIPGARVVRLVGEADLDTAETLDGALTGALASGLPLTVVDLSRTTFADSTVLGVLLRAHTLHEEAGLRLLLAGPLDDVLVRLFDVTGTRAYLRFAADVHQAIDEGDRHPERG
ncbi:MULTISPECIES: STAS domain-containing protein [unclassified Streptomyces]|uniref:STAS domain-containing protein n=1 Tax=unclassified Streptomyces TaxID=2593676 RepID=UPI00081EFE37|nr:MULTISPECIES: STAS domain-containing protein [unclassified Streptomyces]MYR26248.1 STAS domain-containing protein [Streptomyces sp. SID4945]SCE04058.1 anti-sigma B factor antagonist [Streptomyces sp. TverLS-915]SCE98799.1 anti-sigma B factor antagonist [Streptomyces sp. LcepLS]